jgi:hypothetical protein
MKDFKLENGDIVIGAQGDIEMTHGNDLTKQKLEMVLGTNIGEWFFNLSEGICFKNILGKKKDEDIIRGEVVRGIAQVGSDLSLESFTMTLDADRNATVDFSVKYKDVTVEGVNVSWQ